MSSSEFQARFEQMAAAANAIGMQVPPPIFLEMQGEFIDFKEEGVLVVRFPNQERYRNPLGYMQGGIITTAMDNTIGPLSYMLAPASVSTQINTTYIRPITPQDAYIQVEARLVERTKRLLILSAEATNPAGKRVATCTATQMIID